MTSRHAPRRPLPLLLTMMLTLVAVAVPAGAQEFPPDTISIIGPGETPSNAEIAVRLSEETPLEVVDAVVIGRDDGFADALASGVIQSRSPLLLVPSAGPVPERVRAELERLDPQRVILLGGENALAPAVAEELAAMGFQVDRRAGDSRFETATAVAREEAPEAAYAILARAFPAEGATDETQAFADALAAGGLAAAREEPVLLTQSDVLTGTTRDYLIEAGIQEVTLMGGTAAISQAVEEEINAMGIPTVRLTGGNRAETATAVAARRGAPSAAVADHVLLVQGQTPQSWAGGFAAAAHSALLGAPIVLAVTDQLPQATLDWLDGGATSGGTLDPSDGRPVLTCVTTPDLCEDARVALGLPPSGT